MISLPLIILLHFNYGGGYVLSRHFDQLPWLHEKSERGEPVCTTHACYLAEKNILESINTSVDPCDDFYSFACGNWIDSNPVPGSETHWNKFSVLNEQMARQLHQLLLQPIDPHEHVPVQQAKTLFQACMDHDGLERVGVKPLVNLLENLGGWPMAGWKMANLHWYLLLAQITKSLQISPLLDVAVKIDKKDTSSTIITIDQPSLTIPRYELTDSISGVLQPYKKLIAESVKLVSGEYGHDLPQIAVQMETESLVLFETRLAQITQTPDLRRSQSKMYQKLTLGRLQQLTDSVPVINKRGRIQWKPLLTALLSDTNNHQVDENTLVLVKDLHFVYHLLMLVDATPPRVLVNYLDWRVVVALSRDLDLRMRKLTFEYDRIASQVGEDVPRWRECVGATSYMSFAVGYMYTKHFFSHDGKKKAVRMVSEIRNSFRTELEKVDWMDDWTKEAALEKASYMNELIGYPDWFSNASALTNYYNGLEVNENHFDNVIRIREFLARKDLDKLGRVTDRGEWVYGPTTVNAFYNPDLNSIVFPAGILQQPFYHDQQPDYLNYGAIGAIIGHEVIHGFDDTGRQADKLGNLHPWWSKETELTYLTKAQCFINQYNSYRVPQLDSLLHKPVSVNGLLTLGENIADNGGLRAAYMAYQNQKSSTRSIPRLPRLSHFTPDQLFFLSFANVWCESTTSKSLLSEVMEDAHSPHKQRVIGTLSNSPEFSAAWKCPSQSNLNPQNKCQLW